MGRRRRRERREGDREMEEWDAEGGDRGEKKKVIERQTNGTQKEREERRRR